MDLPNIGSSLAGFAILGTIFGVIVRGWSGIRSFLQNCLGILVVSAHLDDKMTSQAVLAYLVRHYRRNKSGERTFGGRYDSFRNGKFGHIPFEKFGRQSMLFWHGWLPFWFCIREEEKSDKGSTVILWGKPAPSIRSCILYVRGTLDVEKIIREASRDRNAFHWNSSSARRFFVKKIPDPRQDQDCERFSAGTNVEWFHEGIYRLLDHHPSELGRAPTSLEGKKAADDLYFPPHVATLPSEARAWRDLKQWYLERGIPWKRGWCLYGPPGTGKTALVRAIAEDLDMPLFVYSLGHVLDAELERSWNEMQAHAPCMALFEDFDTVFHGRENVYGKPTLADQIAQMNVKKESTDNSAALNLGKLSFGCLLNCIDGVEKTGGILTVFTTNHVDKLDPALGQPRKNPDGSLSFVSTRPGRIDKAIELGYMDNADKLRLARRIFFDNDRGYELMVRKIQQDPGKKETPAQFQEECAQLALELLWDDHSPRRENFVADVVTEDEDALLAPHL